jgi:ABC-type dipeptide/oligopeptide/nickel transport system permease component
MYFFSVKLKLLPTTGNASLKTLHYADDRIVSLFNRFHCKNDTFIAIRDSREDYVRTAREKGMKERIVMQNTVLTECINPELQSFGLQFGYLLGGVCCY